MNTSIYRNSVKHLQERWTVNMDNYKSYVLGLFPAKSPHQPESRFLPEFINSIPIKKIRDVLLILKGKIPSPLKDLAAGILNPVRLMVGNSKGFSLMELSAATAAGGILLLAFTSILVYSRQESSAATKRVQQLQDVLVLDRYIHHRLTKCIGDSTLIFADTTAEQSGTPSNSGSILITKDIDNNSHRIAQSNQKLVWQMNGTPNNPVDADISSLNFLESKTLLGKRVNFGIQLVFDKDTLAYEWIIALRN